MTEAGRRGSRVAGILGAMLFSLAPQPEAAGPAQGLGSPPAVARRPHVPRQGDPFSISFSTPGPASRCVLRWGGEESPMWADAGGLHWTGIAGVDLEARPGEEPFEILCDPAGPGSSAAEAESPGPPGWAARGVVPVAAGTFRVEKLKVEPRFVEPPPDIQDRIREERKRLDEALGTRSPAGREPPGMHLPVAGAAGNFGTRRVFNDQPRAPHNGADFRVPAGSPVRAASAGRVVLSEEQYFSGNLVVVDHGGGILTLYAHLRERRVAAGEDVEPGTVIGTVGATGRVTGAHLHWGARIRGARVDPVALAKLLPAASR